MAEAGEKYKLIPGKEMFQLHRLDPETGRASGESELFFDYVSYRVFADIDAQTEVVGEVIPIRNPIKEVSHHAQIELVNGKMSGLYCVPHASIPIFTQSEKIRI